MNIQEGSPEELDAQIRVFENRYEMSSDSMQQMLEEKGCIILKDTNEIGIWNMLLKVRKKNQQK